MLSVKNGMRPIYPGEILREEFMIPMNINAAELAKLLGVPDATVIAISGERKPVDDDMAFRLAVILGTTAEFWTNLQKSYESRMSEN